MQRILCMENQYPKNGDWRTSTCMNKNMSNLSG